MSSSTKINKSNKVFLSKIRKQNSTPVVFDFNKSLQSPVEFKFVDKNQSKLKYK